jgi:hypothetical protein
MQADVGIKGSKISAIGKAGNPDVMDGVTKGMIVGVSSQAPLGYAEKTWVGCALAAQSDSLQVLEPWGNRTMRMQPSVVFVHFFLDSQVPE